MTNTVRIQAFSSPTARRQGTRPYADCTHLVVEETRVRGGEVIAVYTACGRSVNLSGADQETSISHTSEGTREATCKVCNRAR